MEMFNSEAKNSDVAQNANAKPNAQEEPINMETKLFHEVEDVAKESELEEKIHDDEITVGAANNLPETMTESGEKIDELTNSTFSKEKKEEALKNQHAQLMDLFNEETKNSDVSVIEKGIAAASDLSSVESMEKVVEALVALAQNANDKQAAEAPANAIKNKNRNKNKKKKVQEAEEAVPQLEEKEKKNDIETAVLHEIENVVQEPNQEEMGVKDEVEVNKVVVKCPSFPSLAGLKNQHAQLMDMCKSDAKNSNVSVIEKGIVAVTNLASLESMANVVDALVALAQSANVKQAADSSANASKNNKRKKSKKIQVVDDEAEQLEKQERTIIETKLVHAVEEAAKNDKQAADAPVNGSKSKKRNRNKKKKAHETAVLLVEEGKADHDVILPHEVEDADEQAENEGNAHKVDIMGPSLPSLVDHPAVNGLPTLPRCHPWVDYNASLLLHPMTDRERRHLQQCFDIIQQRIDVCNDEISIRFLQIIDKIITENECSPVAFDVMMAPATLVRRLLFYTQAQTQNMKNSGIVYNTLGDRMDTLLQNRYRKYIPHE